MALVNLVGAYGGICADTLTLKTRQIRLRDGSVPGTLSGYTAIFALKTALADADADAIYLKKSADADFALTDYDATDGILYFDALSAAETGDAAKITPGVRYWYALKFINAGGQVITTQQGQITFAEGGIDATS